MRLWTWFVLFCLIASAVEAAEVTEELDVSRSSWIERATYTRDGTSGVGRLTIQIKGEMITYLDVPTNVWEEFKQAESLGAFYGSHIRYRYERVTGTKLSERVNTPVGSATLAAVVCAFNENCEPIVLKVIEGATNRIRVAAYAFTRGRIAAALAEARARGVDVRVKIDARQAEYPGAQRVIEFLRSKDIPVDLIRVEGEYAAMHNKFVVADGRYVVAGSYNFTTIAGVANWENVLWVDAPEIAEKYEEAWEAIASE